MTSVSQQGSNSKLVVSLLNVKYYNIIARILNATYIAILMPMIIGILIFNPLDIVRDIKHNN